MTRPLIAISLASLLYASGASASEDPRYRLRLLDRPAGAGCGLAMGLSENGHVVAMYGDCNGARSPYFHDRSPTPTRLVGATDVDGVSDLGFTVGGAIDGPPVLWTPEGVPHFIPRGRFQGGIASDLNERYDILLRLVDASGQWHSAVFRNGQDLEEIPGLGGNLGMIRINEHGHTCGFAYDRQFNGYAYYYDTERGYSVDPFGGLGGGFFDDLNDRGQAAGRARSRVPQFPGYTGTQAFMWDVRDQSVTPLGWVTKYGYYTSSHGINNHQQIVGFALWQFPGQNPEGGAFFWQEGEIYKLNDIVINLPADSNIVTGMDINDRGQILAEVDFGDHPGHDRWLAILEPVEMINRNEKF